MSTSILQKLIAEDGFCIVKNVLDSNSVLLIPEIHNLAGSQPIVSLANKVLNANARPVKAFL